MLELSCLMVTGRLDEANYNTTTLKEYAALIARLIEQRKEDAVVCPITFVDIESSTIGASCLGMLKKRKDWMTCQVRDVCNA